jgi:predicted RNA binding protein YcfA (HicA-like mRNA interferase family)
MAIRYKVRDILQLLGKDGWVLLRSKGSHRQFAHPIKDGVVTVSYHSGNEEVHPKTAASIFRQAGIRNGGREK